MAGFPACDWPEFTQNCLPPKHVSIFLNLIPSPWRWRQYGPPKHPNKPIVRCQNAEVNHKSSSDVFVLLSVTLPNSRCQSWGIYHIVGQEFLLPVDISWCPVLSAVVMQLFRCCLIMFAPRVSYCAGNMIICRRQISAVCWVFQGFLVTQLYLMYTDLFSLNVHVNYCNWNFETLSICSAGPSDRAV